MSTIISIGLCAIALLALHIYINYHSNKNYNGNHPTSLSATFYHTPIAFRILLVSLGLLLFYPTLIYTGGSLGVDTTLQMISKVGLWLSISGIIGVALFAAFRNKEQVVHIITASIFCAGGAMVGTLITKYWYVSLAIWILTYLYWYVIVKRKYKKKKKKFENGWVIEAVAFDATIISIAAQILLLSIV